MPGFVRMTMLIIKTQQSACLTGFFCCLFLPTTLATLPPNGFSEFGADLFVSCSKVLWGYGHHFPAEKKALSALFTSPRCPGTSLDVSQAALEAHAVAPWPKKQSPLCLLGAPWSLASPAASLSICPPALGSEKVLFPEMSKHGLWLALQSSPGLLLLFLFTGSISENISEGQHECSISVSWLMSHGAWPSTWGNLALSVTPHHLQMFQLSSGLQSWVQCRLQSSSLCHCTVSGIAVHVDCNVNDTSWGWQCTTCAAVRDGPTYSFLTMGSMVTSRAQNLIALLNWPGLQSLAIECFQWRRRQWALESAWPGC